MAGKKEARVEGLLINLGRGYVPHHLTTQDHDAASRQWLRSKGKGQRITRAQHYRHFIFSAA